MAQDVKAYIIETLKRRIAEAKVATQKTNVGTVVEVGDGIARISGLSDSMASEMLEFEDGTFGVAFNLEEGSVGAVFLGDYIGVKEGQIVKSTGRILEVPVGEELVGRVVDPLGRPIDGKGDIKAKTFSPVEKIAPRVIARKSVDTPLQTGV